MEEGTAATAKGRRLHGLEVQSENGHREEQEQGWEGIQTRNLGRKACLEVEGGVQREVKGEHREAGQRPLGYTARPGEASSGDSTPLGATYGGFII